MSNYSRHMWPGTRLATITDEEASATSSPIPAPGPAAADGAAVGVNDNTFWTGLGGEQQFGKVAQGPRRPLHERRSSAPQFHGLTINGQPRASQEAGSMDSEAEHSAVVAGSLRTPRGRRRCSWAGDAVEVVQSIATPAGPGGQEAISPKQLYQHFSAIRDAVLQRAAGQAAQRPDGVECAAGRMVRRLQRCGSRAGAITTTYGGSEAQAHDGEAGGARSFHGLEIRDLGRALERAGEPAKLAVPTFSEPASLPVSPYKTAARASGNGGTASGGLAHVPAARANIGARGMFQARSEGAQQPSRHYPELDLQSYCHNPAPTSSTIRSPFEDVIPDGPEPYNDLYDREQARLENWKAASSPRQNSSAHELGRSRARCVPAAAACTMEAVGSVPCPNSLFSLMPSVEQQPQPSTLPVSEDETCQPQQQANQSMDIGRGGAESQAIAWRGERTAKMNESTSLFIRLSACNGADSQCAAPIFGDDEPDAPNGADILVRPNRKGNDDFTSDYAKAVQSAAQRTLLPLSRVQSGSGIRGGGGTTGLDCNALLSSGWAAVAAASNSATLPHSPCAKAASDYGETAPAGYSSYVALPLAGLPSPPMATGPSCLPPSLAMHLTPSVAAATVAVVRRCLDKGFPMAVIPVKHFASVMTAAEQEDGPLAYHILSTQCVYYPGVGRHAASSGGGPNALGGVDVPVSNAAAADAGDVGAPSSCSKPRSGYTPKKPPSSTATVAAAASVRRWLTSGDALHVMSPGEYQRMQLAAQYSLRQLCDILVAQPSAPEAVVQGAAGHARVPSSAVRNSDSAAAPPVGPGGRVLRHHRRGSSICSESNFCATVVRSKSGLEGGQGDLTATPARPSDTRSISSSGQDSSLPPQPETRTKALIQAAQLGNMARVEYLLKRGSDVNAVESAQQQHQQGTPLGVRGALAGALPGLGAAAGGRTALHYAAFAGSFGVAQLLLHNGAFVGVRDGTGRTAYDLARRKGHDAVAQLLRDAAERREVVRAIATDNRTVITAPAPRMGYPPPVPPRSKQQRSSSAPASGNNVNGQAAALGTNLGDTPSDAPLLHSSQAAAPATVPTAAGAQKHEGNAPFPQQHGEYGPRCPATGAGDDSSVGASPVEYSLRDPLAAAPGLSSAPKAHVAEVRLPQLLDAGQAARLYNRPAEPVLRAVDAGAPQTQDAVEIQGARSGPGAREGAQKLRRPGGLLACFRCIRRLPVS